MMSNRLSGEEKSFRHYVSTPQLDTFCNVNGGASDYMATQQPVVSSIYQPTLTQTNYPTTFSTFSHHKSGADLRYRDDPNPYKVSTIDEFRIKVQDPYKSSRPTKYGSYYPVDDGELEPPEAELRRLSIKYETPVYHHSSASGSSGEADYEIPDPDYDHDGSTADSSEDLPISEQIVRVSPPSGGGDSCEEYSVSISNSEETTSASHSSPSPTTSTKITEAERTKIEYAFKGRKTTIYVADSLANLYYMRKNTLPPRPNSTGSSGSGQSCVDSSTAPPDWVLKYTGIPVLLLDTGETKNRDKRQIQIIIAELGSGLALWKDVVDNLTSYKVTPESSSFHTMHLSSDHTVVVGLSFDDEETAEKFASRVEKLTSDFANISLSGLKRKNKKEKKIKPPKYIRPKKTEISQPCGFQHVASLSAEDKKLFSSLQSFVYGGEKRAKGDKRPSVVHPASDLHL